MKGREVLGGSRCLKVVAQFGIDFGSCLQRSCSNCGNSFCSRCCSFKVPKSSMGATGEWCRWMVGHSGGFGCFLLLKRKAALWERRKDILVQGLQERSPACLANKNQKHLISLKNGYNLPGNDETLHRNEYLLTDSHS